MDRRTFLGAAAPLVIRPELVRGSQMNSAVRLALYGCGGRGTGVAVSFLANTGAVIGALGDLWEDQLTRAQRSLADVAKKAGKPVVAPTALFTGPDSLARLLDSKDVDAVYIATPPYFHPTHLKQVVAAGKHVYTEKPVGVDVAGALDVMETGKKTRGKLSLAVGFQLRYAPPYVELKNRVQAGALGKTVCGLSHYYAGAIDRPAWVKASPQARRLRNWIHDRVLSGDIIVEQNIHLIDVNNWVLGGLPEKAEGVAGRVGRKDSGDCSSHYSVTYTYPGGVHITLTSTQFIEGAWDVAMRYFGTDSNAEMRYDAPVRITGKQNWEYPGLGPQGQNTNTQANVTGAFKGAIEDADAEKEKAFIASITTGRFLNEAQQGAESALSAILGRMAAEKGRAVTWSEMIKSGEKLDAGLDIRTL